MSARTLNEIADEIEQLTNDDPESSHSRADDLLIEALWRLDAGRERAERDEIARIVGAFHRLAKWYA